MYQPVPPSTNPVTPSTNRNRLLLTQYQPILLGLGDYRLLHSLPWVMFRFSSGNTPGFILIFFCFGRRDIFCLRLSEENYPKVNLVPDVPDISILCRRTEEVPRTSIKSEFLPRKKKTLLCCGRNSISYQSRYHFQIKKKQNSVVSNVVFRGK